MSLTLRRLRLRLRVCADHCGAHSRKFKTHTDIRRRTHLGSRDIATHHGFMAANRVIAGGCATAHGPGATLQLQMLCAAASAFKSLGGAATRAGAADADKVMRRKLGRRKLGRQVASPTSTLQLLAAERPDEQDATAVKASLVVTAQLARSTPSEQRSMNAEYVQQPNANSVQQPGAAQQPKSEYMRQSSAEHDRHMKLVAGHQITFDQAREYVSSHPRDGLRLCAVLRLSIETVTGLTSKGRVPSRLCLHIASGVDAISVPIELLRYASFHHDEVEQRPHTGLAAQEYALRKRCKVSTRVTAAQMVNPATISH
jgi:hypothetical protein